MKKIVLLIGMFILGGAFFTINVNAEADNSHPVSTNGNRLRYNTPYRLRDKNLPHRNPVTFEAWTSYDYAIFGHYTRPGYRGGTPIIIESTTGKTGFIDSNDPIAIRSTTSNWGGWVYWDVTNSYLANSVWLTNRRVPIGHLVGNSRDRSVGIGGMTFSSNLGFPLPTYLELGGSDANKPWMTFRTVTQNQLIMPPINVRRTPFLLTDA